MVRMATLAKLDKTELSCGSDIAKLLQNDSEAALSNKNYKNYNLFTSLASEYTLILINDENNSFYKGIKIFFDNETLLGKFIITFGQTII